MEVIISIFGGIVAVLEYICFLIFPLFLLYIIYLSIKPFFDRSRKDRI